MLGLGPTGWRCAAFEKIPVAILSRQIKHISPVEGDHGIRFAPRVVDPLVILDANRAPIEERLRRLKERRTGEVEPLRAAGVMLVTKAGKVLMLKYANSGKWAFPGGKLEDGETAEQAALRECEEEVGVRPEAVSEITRRDRDGVNYTTFIAVIEDEFEPKLSDEHTQARWLPIDDLASESMRVLGLR
jgi:mutator protein MutT